MQDLVDDKRVTLSNILIIKFIWNINNTVNQCDIILKKNSGYKCHNHNDHQKLIYLIRHIMTLTKERHLNFS